MKAKRSRSNGLTRKRSEKNEDRWLEQFARKCARQNEAHKQWLANTAARMRRHYNKQEGPGEDWDNGAAVEFFIRDLFYGDPQAMRGVVVQCIDWLKGIHGIKLTKVEAAGGRWRSAFSCLSKAFTRGIRR